MADDDGRAHRPVRPHPGRLAGGVLQRRGATLNRSTVGALLLADISGYTRFLQDVADAHRAIVIDAPEPPAAYTLISTLLDTMVTAIAPHFRLVKFEGDALFAVADDPATAPTGPAVLACLATCYAAFHTRLDAAGTTWTCRCEACARIGDLDVKFVLHHGGFVVQGIAGREELLGPDVNLVHRLLKNRARDVVGDRPYALITAAAATALAVPVGALPMIDERYQDVPPVRAAVLVLDE